MNRDYDSGFRWGPFEIQDQGTGLRPLRIQQWGGCVRYPYEPSEVKHSQHISQVNTLRPIIHKGCHYGSEFTHPRDYPDHTEWYFWDNCLIPEYQTPPHDQPGKNWCRLVFRGCFPGDYLGRDQDLTEHEHRVTDRLGHTWDQRLQFRENRSRGSRVLLCLSTESMSPSYYGHTQSEIIQRVQGECQRQGLDLHLRPKQPRNIRRRLEDQLEGEWRCVIASHSAIVGESLKLGYPTVSLGQSAYPRECLTWPEFCEGGTLTLDPQRVRQRTRELLALTWHKRELLEGTWCHHRIRICQFRPQEQWQLW